VTYDNYVRLMQHTLKQTFATGDYVFQQGDPANFFYCLLDGELEVLQTKRDGSTHVLNTLQAGEHFGETSLLEGRDSRSVSMRCATPVQVLKLSRRDFEVGFLEQTKWSPTIAKVVPDNDKARETSLGSPQNSFDRKIQSQLSDDELRSKLLGFIQMVNRKKLITLQRGEAVFYEGDSPQNFFVLRSGRLMVAAEGGTAATRSVFTRDKLSRFIGEIHEGEGFGEMALLEGKTKRTRTIVCESERCEVVSLLGSDFLRLVEKSSVVRKSFEDLKTRRLAQTEDHDS